MGKFQLAKNDRWRQERQWYLNLAFYFGQQHVVFKNSQATGSNITNYELYVPPAPYYRVRPTINQTRKFVRKEISRLTSQKPNAYVVPASTEDRDVFAAQAAEQIWDSLWRKHKFNRTVRRAAFWQTVCGNGFLKQFWDPTAYDPINETDGDVRLASETPFHIFIPDLKEEEIEEQPYMIHVMMKNPEWIKNNLGVDVGNSHKLDYVDESLLQVLGANQFSTKDSAPVLEVWYKPNAVPELPNGGMVTIVASRIVQGFEGWPYSHSQYPFSKLESIPTGKFYSESIVTDLIPLQRELNRTRGQIIECVDVATEILTNRGWKTVDEISVGDSVLQYDHTSDSTLFGPLRSINRGSYSGKMHKWDSENISALVTPEHKWIYQSERGLWGESIQINLPHKVGIPLARRVKQLPRMMIDPDIMELAGWFISDGSMHSNGRDIVIYQSRSNKGKFDRLMELFKELDIEPNENIISNVYGESSMFYIPAKIGRIVSGLFPNKEINYAILSQFGIDELEYLLYGLMYGDGSFRQGEFLCYSSINRREADLVQYIATLLGYTTSIYEYDRPGHTSTGKEYRVNFKKTSFAYRPHAAKGTIDFNGEVWCPTVDTGYWVARRNGKVYITGNSKNKMSKPQLAAEEGSMDPSKVTSEPGQVILYRPGFNAPVPIPLQDLPSYVTEEVNRIYTDMADLSGQHDVSEGTVPPGVTAATAISYLQEQDESISSYAFSSMEEAIEKTATQTLTYIKDYWDIPRVVRIVGIDGSFDAQAFKGADLHGNTDIRVEAGSALPTSRAAKQAFILDLMKLGFIPPQEGLEVMEIGGLNKIYERLQVDIRQVQRENLKLRSITKEQVVKHQEAWESRPPEERIDPESGMPLEPPLIIPTNTWDSHQVHIEIHNRYRKSQSFDMAESLTKQLFEEHVKQHQEALMIGASVNVPEDMENPLEQPQEDQQQPGPEPMPETQQEGFTP